ncbi:MAG: hypothetical protein ACJ8HU_08245 [Chthoniobacterales bacterium]
MIQDQHLGQFTAKQIDEAIRKAKEALAAKLEEKRAQSEPKRRRNGVKH